MDKQPCHREGSTMDIRRTALGLTLVAGAVVLAVNAVLVATHGL